MIYEIVTNNSNNPLINENNLFFYEIQFSTEVFKIAIPYELNKQDIFLLKSGFGAKKIYKHKSLIIKNPIKRGDITIETEGYNFLMKKIGGGTNPQINAVLSKLDKNFFPITMLNSLLKTEEIREMIHYMISKKYFSYQVLYTLANIIGFSLKPNLSERVYIEMLKDIREVKEVLETDKKWKIISLFISNYQFNEFLKIKNKLDFFIKELTQIKKYFAEEFFKRNKITDIIIENIKNTPDIQLFISKIEDETLAKAIDKEEVKVINKFISKRKTTRLNEDIEVFYNKENSWEYKLKILRELVNYISEHSPPFYLINQLYQFEEDANIIFDLVGPFKAAIFLKTYPDKSFINSLSPVKKGFIDAFINDKIRKIGGISNKEIKESLNHIKFYLIGYKNFKNIYSLL